MSGNHNSPDWLGLLQWSLAHQDGTAPTNIEMVTVENRQWLERVMTDGFVDEPKKIGQAILTVKEHIEDDCLSSDDVDLLEGISDIIEQIDMAGVFAKIGGLKMIYSLICGFRSSRQSVSEKLLVVALGLAGCATQNHPEVQSQAVNVSPGYDESLLDRLVRFLMDSDNPSVILQTKALYAVSCIVRGHQQAETVFVSRHYSGLVHRFLHMHGYSTANGAELTVIFNSDADAVVGRLLFLSRALLSTERLSADRVRMVGSAMLPICAAGISCPDINIRDSALGLVSELMATAEGREFLVPFQDSLLSACETTVERLRNELTHSTAEDDTKYILEDIAIISNAMEIIRSGGAEIPTRTLLSDTDVSDGAGATLMLT